ncbi:MAG: TonB-dependent receptor [Bacteroidetes bacterium]|nr:TonB-dependent receptor [Bacteroidota bacterium]
MKPKYIFLSLIIFFSFSALAQEKQVESGIKRDTVASKMLNEIVVSALRINIPLREIPAAISVVSGAQLSTMTKTIAADDALRLVPGVKIDNGTGGSRVHVYIRGQGVLTESGFRGIGVYIDGISINNPGGFAPDLYDVDWETVKNIEVVKGLAASMYGASATGGLINITTKDGGDKPVNSSLYTSAGSNGFWKILGQVDGTQGNVNYRISYSHTQSHGYRVHQSYMADNLSEKLTWTPSDKIKITQALTYTSYFNQNSEGINLSRYDTVGHRAANTDAIRYNEFHKTQRLTGATTINYAFAKNQDVAVRGFIRFNNYQETSNNGDDYKPYINPGISAQYNLHFGKENLFNHLSLGVDYQSMKMTEHNFAVPDGDHINDNRVDSYWSEEVFDLNKLLINQVIRQRSTGVFLIDKLDIAKKLYALLNVRYDYVYNRLDSSTISESKTFQKPTFRIGLAYDLATVANIYASYGSGFLAPTEDELYNNPVKYGGFNSLIKPSSSLGGEIGVRGEIGKKFYYDITGFSISSKDEFYRYSVPGRGNNTAFFGNMGESKRWGVETYLSYSPLDFLKFNVAYTYSHFQYTSPDSVSGHWIPQCPQHILTAEASLKFLKYFTATLNIQYESKWYIQVDDSIYNNYTENGIVRSSSERTGFTVANANLNYGWKLGSLKGDLGIFCKNMFDEQYFGFTEPNNGPDYNSYQAAPGREFFVSLRLRL